MDFKELVTTAIKKNEMKKLLYGEGPYEIEMSKFTSDIFPTDVNMVLVNCIYKQVDNIENLKDIFEKCLQEMLTEDASRVYTVVLYFDTCIFQEECGTATFIIEKEFWASEIRKAIEKKQRELEKDIFFSNGMKKSNALKNIQNFNKYYEKKYGFSIM